MMMFPKVDDVRLAWERCVNRTEAITRTVKYGKHESHHKKGDRWKSSPNDRICSIHFVDGVPTPANPLPTLHMGHTNIPKPNKTRKEPAVRTPLVSSRKRKQPAQSSDIPDNENAPQSETNVTNNQPDIVSSPSLSDHNYHATPCACANPVCIENHSIILRLKKRIAQLEQIVEEHERSQKKKTIRKSVIEVKSTSFDIDKYVKTDKQVHFYTGLPSEQHFNLLYDYVYDKVKVMSYWRGKYKVISQPNYLYKRSPVKPGIKRKLSAKAELLMTLMKLRLGLLNHDLADRFHVSQTTVSSIFTTWVKALGKLLKFLVYWPDKQCVKDNLPKSMAKLYPNMRCIIDCTEFFIERPRSLTLQAQTWSDYKHHNTIKVLVGISPRGNICFVSKAWGGRASDRHITLASGILDYVDVGDQWLADRGFLVKGELLERGAELVVPPAGKGHEQMSGLDVQTTKKVANVRIHVERGIERPKRYRFLTNTIALHHLCLFDDIFLIVAALSNLDCALVK